MICKKCLIEKDVSCFSKRKDTKDGLRKQCNDCFCAIKKEYKNSNKEKIKAKNKEYVDRIKHTDEFKNKRRKYVSENRDKINERERSEKYRTKKREYVKKRFETDRIFNIRITLRRRIKSAIDREYKKGSSLELLGCDIDFLKKHIESKFLDGMSWENYGEWHIDHIIPCAKFDLSDHEQQKQCFGYMNLQPLWAKDNLRKGNKV